MKADSVGNGAEPPSGIVFLSSVPVAARSRVESLFYFNPGQSAWLAQIRQTVEETGSPFIEERGRRIVIELPGGLTQCLFACRPAERPVGVAIYSRPALDLLRILHLAVDSSPRPGGADGGQVAAAMVEKIRTIAGQINGVRRIQLPYRTNSFLRVTPSR